MADKIHKEKFYYGGNKRYASGYDRIFGKKKEKKAKKSKRMRVKDDV